MNSTLVELIPAIVSYVTSRGGYVTKTKLLKLLYLIDVDFYRVHRRTLTSFQWKYFHLGPWTNEFDPILDELIAGSFLQESRSDKSEYDTRFFQSNESPDLAKLFHTFKDEAIVKIVLDTWGNRTTAEILDYVYFQTEPMEYGIRNERLDFSRISSYVPEPYKRSSSGKTKHEIARLRGEFKRKVPAANKPRFEFTPPRYDGEFLEAMEKLDSGDL
jgi:hypothetical protein